MKTAIGIVALAVLLAIGGCSFTQSDTTDIGPNSAWKEVSIYKMEAAARVAEAEAKKAEAERSSQPVFEIKSEGAMREYAALQRDQAMLEVVKANAETMKTMARALTGEPEKSLLDVPVQPKDPWAQRIDAAGDAIAGVAQTPAALAVGVAYEVGRNAGTRYEASGQGSTVTTVSSSVSGNQSGATVSPASTSYVDDYNQISRGDAQQAESLNDADDHSITNPAAE